MLALSGALTLCESAAMLGVPWAGGYLLDSTADWVIRLAGGQLHDA